MSEIPRIETPTPRIAPVRTRRDRRRDGGRDFAAELGGDGARESRERTPEEDDDGRRPAPSRPEADASGGIDVVA